MHRHPVHRKGKTQTTTSPTKTGKASQPNGNSLARTHHSKHSPSVNTRVATSTKVLYKRPNKKENKASKLQQQVKDFFKLQEEVEKIGEEIAQIKPPLKPAKAIDKHAKSQAHQFRRKESITDNHKCKRKLANAERTPIGRVNSDQPPMRKRVAAQLRKFPSAIARILQPGGFPTRRRSFSRTSSRRPSS